MFRDSNCFCFFFFLFINTSVFWTVGPYGLFQKVYSQSFHEESVKENVHRFKRNSVHRYTRVQCSKRFAASQVETYIQGTNITALTSGLISTAKTKQKTYTLVKHGHRRAAERLDVITVIEKITVAVYHGRIFVSFCKTRTLRSYYTYVRKQLIIRSTTVFCRRPFRE